MMRITLQIAHLSGLLFKKLFMDASLGDFTKSLEQKISAIVTDNNVKNQSRN